MSTDFALLKRISARDLFDGRLDEFGVREHVNGDETTEKSRCLTDGRNYVWVSIDDHGFVRSLTRYGGNVPGKILTAVADVFDTDIVSEYQPQFWGFETQEEWDASMERMSREADERFHIELLNYLRGEPNDIKPGTIGMRQAEIAKTLVEKDPSLLLPINKDRFRNEIQSIHDREHAVKVTLGPQDIALARLLATHEDDLPRA